MRNLKPKTWFGSTRCDICSEPIPRQIGSILVDACVPNDGRWATMHGRCATNKGVHHYGTGLGQKYSYDGENFVKVLG